MPRIRTSDAVAALRTVIHDEVATAAWNNQLVSKKEQKLLDPFLQEAAAEVRAETGRTPTVDVVAERAASIATAVWDRFSGDSARDKAQLSRAEVSQIGAAHSQLAALTARALGRIDDAGAVRAFFDRVRFPNRELHRGLPLGERVDARAGQAARAEVPPAVLAGFDWWYRAEASDWASASLHRARINGVDVWATYLTTDGDDAYLEIYDAQGKPLASGRADHDALRWDDFFGRGRLADHLVTLSEPVQVDGLSDPVERAQAGQVPQDFAGDLRLASGALRSTARMFDGVDLPASTPAHLRDAAYFALDLLWARTLRHRIDDGEALQLGEEGELVVGAWTNPVDGKEYVVADWRDIDDASYVFYFERKADGLRLAIEQFDN